MNWELNKNPGLNPEERKQLAKELQEKRMQYIMGSGEDRSMLMSDLANDKHQYGKLDALKKDIATKSNSTMDGFADNTDWPIWFHKLDMSKPKDPNTTNYVEDPNAKPMSLITKPGAAAAYEGCAYSHWREPYPGEKCMQVFLHYVRAKGRYTSFAMDGRKYFGQQKQQAIKNVWAQ